MKKSFQQGSRQKTLNVARCRFFYCAIPDHLSNRRFPAAHADGAVEASASRLNLSNARLGRSATMRPARMQTMRSAAANCRGILRRRKGIGRPTPQTRTCLRCGRRQFLATRTVPIESDSSPRQLWLGAIPNCRPAARRAARRKLGAIVVHGLATTLTPPIPKTCPKRSSQTRSNPPAETTVLPIQKRFVSRPTLGSVESAPEVRVLPSAGVTQPRQVLRPCPTPAGTIVETMSEARPPSHTGLPQLPGSPFRHAVPTTPMDQNGCNRRLLPRSTRPSPLFRRVGVHDFTFEACSGFTHVTACRIAQPPKGGLCHEASARPVTRSSRSSATRAYRQLPGWNLPPLVNRAVGAHCIIRASELAPENVRYACVYAIALNSTGTPAQAMALLERAHH